MKNSEGEQDRDAESDLLPGIGWQEEDEEDDEGHEDTRDDEGEHVEGRLPFEIHDESDSGERDTIDHVRSADCLKVQTIH